MLGSFIFCEDLSTGKDEHIAIKKVIEAAYVRGFFLNRDAEAMRNGFHPEFNILMLNKEGKLGKLPIAKWTEIVETRLKDKKETNITHKFPMIDVTGNAAVVKIEIYRDGKLLYSDYLSLYKFADGWKIVNKIYYQHK
jgi:hypothetical protein